MTQRITALRLLRPLTLALALAGASAQAQPVAAPDSIATSTPATAAVPAPAAPAATPEQQAALAGARAANAPAPANVLATQAPSAAGSLLQTVISLGFVIALLVGLAWLLKRFGPKHITGGTTVKLVGALSVGARERILVVEVGEQWIVVGASPGRMNALATMPRQDIDELDLARAQALPGAPNFAEWFKQTIEKRNGK
ncbi:MAG: fliO [Pseudoduganella sp.]|jgi:flagellar protein FliO/FliZ|nr:fliO [Pseudoduganella sp.]